MGRRADNLARRSTEDLSVERAPAGRMHPTIAIRDICRDDFVAVFEAEEVLAVQMQSFPENLARSEFADRVHGALRDNGEPLIGRDRDVINWTEWIESRIQLTVPKVDEIYVSDRGTVYILRVRPSHREVF